MINNTIDRSSKNVHDANVHDTYVYKIDRRIAHK